MEDYAVCINRFRSRGRQHQGRAGEGRFTANDVHVTLGLGYFATLSTNTLGLNYLLEGLRAREHTLVWAYHWAFSNTPKP